MIEPDNEFQNVDADMQDEGDDPGPSGCVMLTTLSTHSLTGIIKLKPFGIFNIISLKFRSDLR